MKKFIVQGSYYAKVRFDAQVTVTANTLEEAWAKFRADGRALEPLTDLELDMYELLDYRPPREFYAEEIEEEEDDEGGAF